MQVLVDAGLAALSGAPGLGALSLGGEATGGAPPPPARTAAPTAAPTAAHALPPSPARHRKQKLAGSTAVSCAAPSAHPLGAAGAAYPPLAADFEAVLADGTIAKCFLTFTPADTGMFKLHWSVSPVAGALAVFVPETPPPSSS